MALPTSAAPLTEIEFLDGRRYVSWHWKDVGETQSADISDVPTFSTLTLFEAIRTDGSGTDQIQPSVEAIAPQGSASDLTEIVSTTLPGRDFRVQCRAYLVAPENKVRVDYNPTGSPGVAIEVRITVVEGHE